jgi:hypothetical protein
MRKGRSRRPRPQLYGPAWATVGAARTSEVRSERSAPSHGLQIASPRAAPEAQAPLQASSSEGATDAPRPHDAAGPTGGRSSGPPSTKGGGTADPRVPNSPPRRNLFPSSEQRASGASWQVGLAGQAATVEPFERGDHVARRHLSRPAATRFVGPGPLRKRRLPLRGGGRPGTPCSGWSPRRGSDGCGGSTTRAPPSATRY